MEKKDTEPGSDLAYLIREEMGNSMPIDIWYEGDIWVFRPFGRIDTGHAVDLDAALTEGIDQGMNLIVIDLTDTTYVASSGLRAIIKAAKAVKSNGGMIKICGMSEPVSEVFRLSGLLKIFVNYPTFDEVIKNFRKRSE